jgi:hypothetical protein
MEIQSQNQRLTKLEKFVGFKACRSTTSILNYTNLIPLIYNRTDFSFPNITSFNLTTGVYTMPSDGYYHIIFKTYVTSVLENNSEIGLFKNDVLVCVAGASGGSCEGINYIGDFAVNDTIIVKVISGAISLKLGPAHTVFSGYKIV